MRDSYLQSTLQNESFMLDPRTKILVMLMVNVAAFTMSEWYVLALTAAIPLTLLAWSGHRKSAVIWAIIYTMTLAGQAYLVDAFPGGWNIVIVMLTGVITRMLPALLLGYYLLSTTTVSQFVAAMEKARVPQQIIIPLSVMFRFFPTIAEESGSIKDAMRMRGITLGKTRGGPAALLEYRLVPLFISCVKIGEELSGAALTRGMGAPVKRTNICRIGFHAADAAYLALSAAVFCMYILL